MPTPNPSSSGASPRSTWHVELRKILETYFDEDELETLCFDLRVDYESLAGDTKTHKVVDLVRTFARTGRIEELIDYCSRMRPNVPWGELRQQAARNPLVVDTRPDEPRPAPQTRGPATSPQRKPWRGRFVTVLVTVIAVAAAVVAWNVIFDGGAPEPTVSASPPATSQTSPPAPAQSSTGPTDFRVVEVILRADPAEYVGPCPVTITFSGRISVAGGGGTVSYKFLRNDGASAPVQTLVFDSPGSKDVMDTWTLGGDSLQSYSGWQAIQIFDPEERTSNEAAFSITCT